jgi:DNA-binding NtrC family response regulator
VNEAWIDGGQLALMPDDKTVLLVADHETILNLFEAIFSEGQYRVVARGSPDRAPALIKETMPDLAILDVWTSVGPDRHLLDLVDTDAVTAQVTLLVLAGSELEAREAKAHFDDNGRDFLPMPFELDDLFTRVERLAH